MRLDKFLKISRIIKRRPIAKDIANQGRIKINGKTAKSSTDVHVNDKIAIEFGNKTLTIQINKILDTTKKSEAEDTYTILSEDYKRDYRMNN